MDFTLWPEWTSNVGEKPVLSGYSIKYFTIPTEEDCECVRQARKETSNMEVEFLQLKKELKSFEDKEYIKFLKTMIKEH